MHSSQYLIRLVCATTTFYLHGTNTASEVPTFTQLNIIVVISARYTYILYARCAQILFGAVCCDRVRERFNKYFVY